MEGRLKGSVPFKLSQKQMQQLTELGFYGCDKHIWAKARSAKHDNWNIKESDIDVYFDYCVENNLITWLH